MFRPLIMAISRLYMKHLVSSCTKHIYGLLIWGREGVKWARDLVSVLKVGRIRDLVPTLPPPLPIYMFCISTY